MTRDFADKTARTIGTVFAAFVLTLMLMLALLAASTRSAQAQTLTKDTITDSCTGTSNTQSHGGSGVTFAQTFTANATKNVSRLDVFASGDTTSTGLVMDVRTVDAATRKPTDTVLGSVTVSANDLPEQGTWVKGRFSSPVSLVAGKEYAVGVTGTVEAHGITWYGDRTSPCPGTLYQTTNMGFFTGDVSDMFFRLYSSVPAHLPVASPDGYNVNEDGTLNVPAAGVLSNDTDTDGDAVSAALASVPQHGTLVLNPNGSFSYSPAANFNGSDSFAYNARDVDGNSQQPATVDIAVASVNDAPDATDIPVRVKEDVTVNVDALARVNDADGGSDLDPATLRVGGSPDTGGVPPALPSHGTATANSNGTITYAPNADFNGSDSFTYEVCDRSGACDRATASITVVPVNDAPEAKDDFYEVAENTTLEVSAPGVLANDTDKDSGDTLASDTWNATVFVAHGTMTLNTNGSFSYTPDRSFVGTDSFEYDAYDDGAPGAEDIATVTITVVGPDTVGPDVSLASPGEGSLVRGATNLTADASDKGGVSGVEFLLDGNVVGADDSAPYEFQWNSEAASEGSHGLSVRASDVAGNQTTSGVKNVVVDNIDPDTAITGGPAEGSFVKSASASFALTSTESSSTFECSLDGSAAQPCEASLSLTGLSEGTHALRVWAVGSAGRADDLDTAPAARTWTVDTVNPAGTVKINNGAAKAKRRAVVLNLSATDLAPASGVSKMRFSHDGKTWTAWQTYAAKKAWTLKKGAARTRVVFVQFMDKAGNSSLVVKDTIKYTP